MPHTPGPWEIDRTGKYYKPCIRRNGIIVAYLPDNTAGLVLEADRKRQRSEDDNNAHLLKTAPKLLGLALGYLRYLETRPADDLTETLMETIRTTIAEAEGR